MSFPRYPLPRAIPSAVDPHAVERAWPRAPRWSALPDVRPWRPRVGLLGFAWVDGGRDGATSQKLEAPPPAAGTGSSTAREHWPVRRPMPAGGRHGAWPAPNINQYSDSTVKDSDADWSLKND